MSSITSLASIAFFISGFKRCRSKHEAQLAAVVIDDPFAFSTSAL